MPRITKNNLPKKVKSNKSRPKKSSSRSKTKHSPIDYYNCLLTYANQNWHDKGGTKKKITACCKDCKMHAPVLRKQRDQEIQKAVNAYKEMGESLTKLLKPIN